MRWQTTQTGGNAADWSLRHFQRELQRPDHEGDRRKKHSFRFKQKHINAFIIQLSLSLLLLPSSVRQISVRSPLFSKAGDDRLRPDDEC